MKRLLLSGLLAAVSLFPAAVRAEMTDMPIVRLQSLDKVSARTMTFEARVGSTVKFGTLFIKTQACRKAPPIEQPESAAFLQIWENSTKEGDPKWVFSGWMFASSPALSSMDHPIYDVWVLDCLERKTGEAPPAETPAPVADKAAAKPEDAKKAKPAKAEKPDTKAEAKPETKAGSKPASEKPADVPAPEKIEP